MKTPRFEEMATRWGSQANFFIVFSREAHAAARHHKPLEDFADEVMTFDKNGDNTVTRAEFEGPDERFAPFDLDANDVISSHELLSARGIAQFADVKQPETMQERIDNARQFRKQVPGDIPVLVDAMDNAVRIAYGKRPNSAFVIDTDCKIAAALDWASTKEVEEALRGLAGDAAPKAEAQLHPDWTGIKEALGRAAKRKTKVVLEFTAPGCGACEAMESTTLSDAKVSKLLEDFERQQLGVEDDAAWALFEALDLSATPAFVILEPGDGAPTVVARLQGLTEPEPFSDFLSAPG